MRHPVMRPVSWSEVFPTVESARAADPAVWQAEVKWDGVRAVAVVDGDDTRLYSRTGRNISAAFPEVVTSLSTDRPGVYDGELVTGSGRSEDFPTVNRRAITTSVARAMQLRRSDPAHFICFDVLEQERRPITHLPYLARREHLVGVPSVAGTPDTLWEFVQKWGAEGMVLKRLDSRYTDGKRHRDWLKVKRMAHDTFEVVGTEPGTGSRAATFGALLLATMVDGEHRYAGKVGTGFTDGDLVDIVRRLRRGERLFVDVEHAGMTDGALRFPVFRGVRQDTEED